MKFNPDKDHQKHRDAHGGIHFIQSGHKFTAGGKDLGEVKNGASAPKRKKKLSKKEKVRKSAADKLKGFKDRDVPGPVNDALKENRAAAAAEERA